MKTETIDRLFLELSQVTKATTARELALIEENSNLRRLVKAVIIKNDRIVCCDLSEEGNWFDFRARVMI